MDNSQKILPYLERWLTCYLPNVEGRKPNTIKSYKATWRLVMRYFMEDGVCPDKVTYGMLTYEKLIGFLGWLDSERKCGTSTRNNRLAAISRFARYSLNRDYDSAYDFHQAIQKIPFKKPASALERAYFTKDEVKILLDSASPRDCMGMRDHVLLQFMYASGERAQEVCNTMVGDVRFMQDDKASLLVHGKGGKTRRIKIPSKPSAVLKKYIYYRRIGNQPEAHIFPSQRNEMMSVSCIEEIFKKYVSKAKKEHPDLFMEPSYPPHSMRHTTAVHMLEAGVPMIVVKQFLGHEHLSTTEVYAKMTPETINAKISDWDRKYWSEYIDASLCEMELSGNESDMPDFLR